MDADRLKKIPVFADLDPAATSMIAQLASEVSVPAGRELVREGDYSYDVLAIEEGTAEVTCGGRHVADLAAGDIVGEIGVLEQARRNATVTATSPMLLVALDRWDVKRLGKQSSAVLEHLEALIAERKGGE
ncbi:MAG: cyclic nucleotide-binding domain-containing protein [Actinomycetota bacterium]|nr:cyclic nucleotide-binding domain-containing protein [Actinomycetota bacterium]